MELKSTVTTHPDLVDVIGVGRYHDAVSVLMVKTVANLRGLAQEVLDFFPAQHAADRSEFYRAIAADCQGVPTAQAEVINADLLAFIED